MKEYRTWQEILLERLAADKKRAIGYLDVALEEYQEDGDTPFFLLGLQNVIESQGGVSEVAKKINIAPTMPLGHALKRRGTAPGYAQDDTYSTGVSVVYSTAKGYEFQFASCRQELSRHTKRKHKP